MCRNSIFFIILTMKTLTKLQNCHHCPKRPDLPRNKKINLIFYSIWNVHITLTIVQKYTTAQTTKSGDFEVADSCGQFRGIGHLLEESATFEYIMYIKDQRNRQLDSGIGNRSIIINPVWHDVGKQEKCSSLEPPSDNFYKTQ